MLIKQYSHPKHFQWFKKIFALLAFLHPIYMLVDLILSSIHINALVIILFAVQEFFVVVFTLVAAYFFQDIGVDEDGLVVEFLWMKIRVKWKDIEKIKPAVFSRHSKIVLVKRLSLFHIIFGLLYGFTIKSAFIIDSTISNYELLIKEIEKHIN